MVPAQNGVQARSNRNINIESVDNAAVAGGLSVYF